MYLPSHDSEHQHLPHRLSGQQVSTQRHNQVPSLRLDQVQHKLAITLLNICRWANLACSKVQPRPAGCLVPGT
ncbi:hypothetical protein HaLaN_14687, partial [Haematococcus lacustris]